MKVSTGYVIGQPDPGQVGAQYRSSVLVDHAIWIAALLGYFVGIATTLLAIGW